MRSTNVEVARDALAAFIDGELESALAYADPQIVTFRAPPLPDAGEYHGREGVLQAWREWAAMFGQLEMSAEPPEAIGDRDLIAVDQRGTGEASGASVEARFWLLYAFAAGKIVRLDIFNSRAQALSAAAVHGPG